MIVSAAWPLVVDAAALLFAIFSMVGVAMTGNPSEKGLDANLSGAGSEPASSPVKTEPAEQEYHDDDDQQRIRIHGHTSLKFSTRRMTDFPRPPDCRNHGPDIDAVIGSENTHPQSAG
jgi:hypothetical protein